MPGFIGCSKTTQVDKIIPATIDVGNLCVIDLNPVDQLRSAADRASLNEALLKIARDNTQLLANAIFTLPQSSTGTVVLPKGTSRLPREKPVPKPKAPTRWDKYAKEKGITKNKKTRLEFNEATQSYVPRTGASSAKNMELNDWIREVPEGADPMEDQFQKAKGAKKKRVAKNEGQRRKNLNIPKIKK